MKVSTIRNAFLAVSMMTLVTGPVARAGDGYGTETGLAAGSAALGAALFYAGLNVVQGAGTSTVAGRGTALMVAGPVVGALGIGTAIGMAFSSNEKDPVKALLKTHEFQEFAKAKGEKLARQVALDIVAGLALEELMAKYPGVFTRGISLDGPKISYNMVKPHSSTPADAVSHDSEMSEGSAAIAK